MANRTQILFRLIEEAHFTDKHEKLYQQYRTKPEDAVTCKKLTKQIKK